MLYHSISFYIFAAAAGEMVTTDGPVSLRALCASQRMIDAIG